MRILFAATGEIALPLLDALAEKGLIAAVMTAPDAPGKRGRTLIPSPIKVRALELGLPVYTPETLRTEARTRVRGYEADMLLSFCYGRIFGPKFLSLFKRTMNIHPSPLPLYRGCSPLYGMIRDSARHGAVSVQEIALGVDEGNLYGVLPFELRGDETEASLTGYVASIVPGFVLGILDNIESIVPYPQQGEASYTSFVSKDDGRICFSDSAAHIHSVVRACYPWPKAYAMRNGEKLFITGVYGSAFDAFEPCSEAPGTVVSCDKAKGLRIATGDGYLYVTRVLPPAKKEMDAISYANGQKSILGSILE